MKAYELREFGFDGLVLSDRPDPRPGPGEVLLRMRAASLNYRDLMVVQGRYNPKLRRPIVPLSDGVGEVVGIGDRVSRVKVGDRVAASFFPDWVEGEPSEERTRTALGGGSNGVLAEYVVLPERGVVPVPEHLTDAEAATLPCAAVTAWNALVSLGGVRPGETVLTQGTGGVSLFALQFARLAGARVIATSSSSAKLDRVRELGAAEGINYHEAPDWGDRARKLTGAGVDHVVEVGGAGTLEQSLRAVRMGGRISLIGILSGGGEVNPVPVLMKCVRVQGIYVGPRAVFEQMNRAIAEHHLRPVVDRVFPFTEAVEALRYMESGSHFGKICLKW